MTIVDLQELARQMLADADAGTPGAHKDDALIPTAAEAYALQTEIARLREQRGEQVIGYKVGCISKSIQEQLGVQEPVFGRLFDTGRFRSGAYLSCARFVNPAVEGEFAVRLGADLPASRISTEECRAAIAEVFPVIELHHYVLPAGWAPGQWLIASGGMHAGFVVAETEAQSSHVNTTAFGLAVRINGEVVGTVDDYAACNHPIESVRWLAGRLRQFGLRLCKGQVILTGSPLPLYPVAPGSRVVVEAPPLGISYVALDP